jgi:hypothetical protein
MSLGTVRYNERSWECSWAIDLIGHLKRTGDWTLAVSGYMRA